MIIIYYWYYYYTYYKYKTSANENIIAHKTAPQKLAHTHTRTQTRTHTHTEADTEPRVTTSIKTKEIIVSWLLNQKHRLDLPVLTSTNLTLSRTKFHEFTFFEFIVCKMQQKFPEVHLRNAVDVKVAFHKILNGKSSSESHRYLNKKQRTKAVLHFKIMKSLV